MLLTLLSSSGIALNGGSTGQGSLANTSNLLALLPSSAALGQGSLTYSNIIIFINGNSAGQASLNLTELLALLPNSNILGQGSSDSALIALISNVSVQGQGSSSSSLSQAQDLGNLATLGQGSFQAQIVDIISGAIIGQGQITGTLKTLLGLLLTSGFATVTSEQPAVIVIYDQILFDENRISLTVLYSSSKIPEIVNLIPYNIVVANADSVLNLNNNQPGSNYPSIVNNPPANLVISK